MSANINFNTKTKKYSFAAKGIAWHRLGKNVNEAMTSKEAIELAQLGYIVDKAPLKAMVETDEDLGISEISIPDNFATYRRDTGDVFGVVGSKYEIVQNKDAFKFIDSIIGEEKAIFETAGALGKGETVFITAKLPYYIKINGYDTIENYLVVSLSHDGSSSVSIFLTPIRVVCANTLALAKTSTKFKINLRHTMNVHEKIEDAGNILSISKTITEETQELYKVLANTKIEDEVAENYFKSVFLTNEELEALAIEDVRRIEHSDIISSRKKNILTSVNKYYVAGVGQEKIVGTAFGAYNAVTGYLSNVKKYSNDTKRMKNLVLGGTDYSLNNKALTNITTLI